MISAWLLILLVPVAAGAVAAGAFLALKLIDRLMLEAFKGIWR